MNSYRRQVAIVGYAVIGIFFLAYVILNLIQHWFAILALSQPIIIAFAVLVALPLIFAFVWERLTAVKAFNIEIKLADISLKRLDIPLIDALKGASRLKFGFELTDPFALPDLTLSVTQQLQIMVKPAIKQAGTADLIDINLGKGDLWLSSRLYLIVALAEDYFGIKHINFLEEYDGQDNCFIGLATPRAILRALAVAYPPLERTYREAYDRVTNEKSSESQREKIITPVEEVTNLMILYFSQFYSQGSEEKQVANWVTKPLLKQWLGQDLKMISVECKGIECECPHPPLPLLYNIINCPAPFVALVQNRRLIEVVNRYETAIAIAETVLKQQTRCGTVDEFD